MNYRNNPKDLKDKPLIPKFSLRESLTTLAVLFMGLIITLILVYFTKVVIERAAIQDFEFTCHELRNKIDNRLEAHAQLLRSGAGLFAVSDSVTRDEWSRFFETVKLNEFLPGIQGFGYSQIIPKELLDEHINTIREEGFPEYTITPLEEREFYTSIIYLEPFSGRNLRAFGFDMFSEPIRRRAMEISRDSGNVMLSGKVTLVQETTDDVQSGALMYFPVFRNNRPVNTVEDRRRAIKGWVYSPYRIKDLMQGILGNGDLPGNDRIHLKIYDDTIISKESLLYDSHGDAIIENLINPNLYLRLPVHFRSKIWTLEFTRKSEEMTLLNPRLLIVLFSGIFISILLFFLTTSLIRSRLNLKQINSLNMQLEKLNIDKDRFISILAHDLKAPFNSVIGFLEVLSTDYQKLDSEKVENYINYSHSAAKNAYNLLEELLQWSQSGKLPYLPEYVKVKDIYNHITKSLEANANLKNIKILYHGKDDVKVYADGYMLKTILRNLVSNAIKFTNYGGEIVVRAEEKQGYMKISVSDNGIGIEPEDLQKLFDISHVHTTKGTADERGTGLGLYLTKEFVERHNGTINVESLQDKGSTFTFFIPAERNGN